MHRGEVVEVREVVCCCCLTSWVEVEVYFGLLLMMLSLELLKLSYGKATSFLFLLRFRLIVGARAWKWIALISDLWPYSGKVFKLRQRLWVVKRLFIFMRLKVLIWRMMAPGDRERLVSVDNELFSRWHLDWLSLAHLSLRNIFFIIVVVFYHLRLLDPIQVIEGCIVLWYYILLIAPLR